VGDLGVEDAAVILHHLRKLFVSLRGSEIGPDEDPIRVGLQEHTPVILECPGPNGIAAPTIVDVALLTGIAGAFEDVLALVDA
jgi:hypothetical protein